MEDIETDADSVFSSSASVSSASSVDSSYSTRSVSRYRQRYGRGGRVYLDRTLTTDEKENLEKTQLKEMMENPILQERMRYDPRACEDEKPVTLDEFSIEYISFQRPFPNFQANSLSSSASPSSSPTDHPRRHPREHRQHVQSANITPNHESLHIATISRPPNSQIGLSSMYKLLRISQLMCSEFLYERLRNGFFLKLVILLVGLAGDSTVYC
jgi:hypothetical protein